MTSARIVTPGQAMATTPTTTASTPSRISELDLELSMAGIPLLSEVLTGEERQQCAEELAGLFQVRDVAAVGYHHALGAGDVLRGRGGQRGEVAEPGGLGGRGVLAERDGVVLGSDDQQHGRRDVLVF